MVVQGQVIERMDGLIERMDGSVEELIALDGSVEDLEVYGEEGGDVEGLPVYILPFLLPVYIGLD